MRRQLATPLLALLIVPACAAIPQPASTTATSPHHNPQSLPDAIRPALKHAGFAMDGYFLWCSSIIKVGDTYHMFASRWPAAGGIAAWTTQSECVRATSRDLLGPYTFQQVVLQKRPGQWDNSRVHNVKIVRAPTPDGREHFVLFYINTANQTGYADADSITGPWTRCSAPVMHFSNPAPLVMPDGSIYCFGRLKQGTGPDNAVAATAPSYKGPYKMIDSGGGGSPNLLTNNAELEDPTIWWANHQYNVLVTDIGAKATGINKAGTEYFSKDGIHYHLVSKTPVFTKTVLFDDGSSETFARRERPFVYTNDRGEVIALFTACMPSAPATGARIIANPVDRYYPSN